MDSPECAAGMISVAVYVLSDPVRAAAQLREAADRYGVPRVTRLHVGGRLDEHRGAMAEVLTWTEPSSATVRRRCAIRWPAIARDRSSTSKYRRFCEHDR
jgi:hypothetical protein